MPLISNELTDACAISMNALLRINVLLVTVKASHYARQRCNDLLLRWHCLMIAATMGLVALRAGVAGLGTNETSTSVHELQGACWHAILSLSYLAKCMPKGVCVKVSG